MVSKPGTRRELWVIKNLARYYDMHGAAQEIAPQATEAFVNTIVFQRLVGFAEENYVVHRQLFNKIAERVEAGRDERVNLEQASARMALVESNLLTEVTNLHDTRAELQRVLGKLPANSLPVPTLPTTMLPSIRDEALEIAYKKSPRVDRAIEEMRSACESMNATRGPLMPRFDLRYRNEQESNIDGFEGDYDAQGFNADRLKDVEPDLERRDHEQIAACSTGVVPAIDIDQESIFKRLEKRATAGSLQR